MIATERLRLIELEARHRQAFAEGRAVLAQLLAVRVADDWPEFPEALAPLPASHESSGPWRGYLFIDPAGAALVGNGGFYGPPNEQGEVEIGYETAPAFRGRGFATEVVRALVSHAFGNPGVRAVVAHTLAETNASNRVLLKAGMSFVGELDNAEVGKVWRWCRVRPSIS